MTTTSLKRNPCPCVVVQEDSWELIMSFCIPYELCMLALTSKFLRKQSDKSESWYFWCQKLWKDKQYHPLERWVRLKPFPTPSIARRSFDNNIKEEQNILQILDTKLLELEKQKADLLCNNMDNSVDSMEATNSSFNEQLLTLLEGRLSTCSKYRQVVASKIDQLKKLRDYNNSKEDNREEKCQQMYQERLAAPLSRAVRAEWIQSTECEYFNTLDKRDVAEAKLSALSSCNSSTHANILMTNQKLFDSLLNEVTQLQLKADALKIQINHNISKKVNMSVSLANAAANGTLLSWKQSYYASIVDSKRVVITPEVLSILKRHIIYFIVIIVIFVGIKRNRRISDIFERKYSS